MLIVPERRKRLCRCFGWLVWAAGVGAIVLLLIATAGCGGEDTRTPEERERARAKAAAEAEERRYWRCMKEHERVPMRYRLPPPEAHQHCVSNRAED